MNTTKTECAMCDTTMYSTYSSYSLPPLLVEDMKNSDAVNAADVSGKVSVDLCEGCTEIANRMVMEFDTSPLPECDAERVRFDDAETMNALAGEDVARDGLAEGMIEDALSMMKMHADGDADRVLNPEVVEARVIVFSAQNLGLIESDPL